MTATGGRFPGGRFAQKSDGAQPLFDGRLSRFNRRSYQKADRSLTFDKLDSVYGSGNRSRDNQPNHLRIRQKVPEVIGEAWIRMCPAGVYEWGPVEPVEPAQPVQPTETDQPGQRQIQISPTNCIQCGAITAKGGRLTPPEGGSGPEYTQM
ncbi:MAG: 4Fe-4S dicluster domain-containing protein [Deltaproteobacteria bacterium]|nr:4Fe-4S dicluster domain-containing protein [Deltaproteobacteria bacterium]